LQPSNSGIDLSLGFQLKIDVDVYNDLNPSEEPIQVILNFEDDVTERQYWDDDGEAA
jgi:hypothetical protein